MSRFLKIALAVGGAAALWMLTRSDDDDRGSSYGGGSGSAGTGAGAGAGASPAGGGGASAGGGDGGGSSSGGGAEAGGGSGSESSDAPTPEQDGGVVRDGRMRGGTWNFAPSDAPKDSSGFLVLRDVPKSAIEVDGRTVELRGGFRGFREVPAGAHKLELEGYGGTKVRCEVDMPPGGCIVLIYEDSGGKPRLEPDRDWGPQYIGLAMGGAMGQALWPWPEEK